MKTWIMALTMMAGAALAADPVTLSVEYRHGLDGVIVSGVAAAGEGCEAITGPAESNAVPVTVTCGDVVRVVALPQGDAIAIPTGRVARGLVVTAPGVVATHQQYGRWIVVIGGAE
jgi:hypothetical protein